MADNFRKNPRDEEGYKFDSYAHAVTVISEPHRLAHDGMVFHAERKVTGIADAGVSELLLAVPAGSYPHMHRFRTNVGRGDVDIDVYEGTTTSADGTAVGAHNTNRNSSRSAELTLTHTPTITTDGTLLHQLWVPPTGTGVGQTFSGVSNAEAGEEWIMKPATKYLIRFTNNSGTAITIWTEMLWYEIDYEQ